MEEPLGGGTSFAPAFRQCLRRVTFAFAFVFSRENLDIAKKYGGMAIFAVLLVIFTMPVWLVVKVNDLITTLRPGFKPRAMMICNFLIGWAWWLVTTCACCIFRLRKEGVEEMNESMRAGAGKPRLIIFNHTSFMDAMVAAAHLATGVSQDAIAIVSSHLLEIPLLGGLVRGSGHLPLKFRTQTTHTLPESKFSLADMTVDKDSTDWVIQEFENWVREGRVGMWFPEGRLNPHPLQLQMFRAGGFKIAVEVDCEMWCCVYGGLEVFWHRKALVGGVPANCGMKAFRLCSSSHALIQELSGGDRVDDKLRGMLLANHAHAKMQEKRDEMTADPWISKLQDLVGAEMTGVAMVEYRSGSSLAHESSHGRSLYQNPQTPSGAGGSSASAFSPKGTLSPRGERTPKTPNAAEEAHRPTAASSAAGASLAVQAGRSGGEPVDLLGPMAPRGGDRAGGGPSDLLGDPEERVVVRNLGSFTASADRPARGERYPTPASAALARSPR